MPWPALIVATLLTAQVPADADMVPDSGSAEIVFSCDFDPSVDLNFDRWPDGWTRRRDVEYPAYIPVSITSDAETGNPKLRIELDGGAAAIYSPPIAVSQAFSYVVEGRLRTEGIKNDVAYYSVTFFNAKHEPRQTYYSRQFHLVEEWTPVQIGPAHPESDDAVVAVIGLHLRPTDDFDLVGAAEFDGIRLSRRPRMTLSSNSPHNVYREQELVEFTCEFSGVIQRNPQVTFEVLEVATSSDADSAAVESETILARHTEQAANDGAPGSDLPINGYSGTISWQPPIEAPGCYRLRVTMRSENDSGAPLHERSTMFAIVPPASSPETGEFGWTLSQGDDPLALGDLVDLLGQTGVNWVKFPVWYAPEDQHRADQLAWFAERLSAQNVNLVGVLDQPPAELRDRFLGEGDLLAANLFQESELWHPVLNPVTTRLSLKVHWWQLGSDEDTSFMAYPQLALKISEIKQNLERFGQEMQIGLGWNWMYQGPDSAGAPWSFLSFHSDPPLTAAELSSYLAASDASSHRWIVLEPLPRDGYNAEQRARDLVQRMLAAKLAGVEAVFASNPFDERTGLMNPDGTPSELLIPWRTAALQLAGTTYLGSIDLPSGSQNQIFTRGDQAVMVIWNDRPTTETVYLGEAVQQLDLWGHVATPETSDDGQTIQVGTLPSFVTGIQPQIAELRMSCKFRSDQLASIFSREQTIGIALHNPFPQGISGRARLVLPEDWGDPQPVQFEAPGDETINADFRILLKPDAGSGLRQVRIDFDINADRNYQFSVYRTLEIGLGDILLEHSLDFGPNGELIVEQYLINRSNDSANFNCYLFVPGRRHMRQQIIDLGQGRSKITYLVPDGEELLGQTIWMQAEEIGGERVLNRRIVVEQ